MFKAQICCIYWDDNFRQVLCFEGKCNPSFLSKTRQLKSWHSQCPNVFNVTHVTGSNHFLTSFALNSFSTFVKNFTSIKIAVLKNFFRALFIAIAVRIEKSFHFKPTILFHYIYHDIVSQNAFSPYFRNKMILP